VIATRFSRVADRYAEKDEFEPDRCQTTAFNFASGDGSTPPQEIPV